ncbi:SDR family NAD(P)-dependent oxidoreductase [Egicoccus halophilus]|uniref:NADP-dependent 3-hydroxy acid dehydrogenase YdfG n=1 Tax=Egicoccus halophilus TaxID=1670830 RepID=A0A8J3AB56_9ACTN|nr:SDR family oxidoreductase [Egicoccus halophilus]GGI09569.1 SDR family oxidoreductase [Egicoccus halophilus]
MQGRVRRALVTGASSGIGEAFARHLADRGVEVVLVARRAQHLHALADTLPTVTEVLGADLTRPAETRRVEERLAATTAPVDLLVNAAGVGAYGAFGELDVDEQTRLTTLNAVALLRCSRAVLPQLLARDTGGIVQVGSLAGWQPDPFAAVYGASKAFVHALGQALHEETRGTRVTVSVVAPGLTATGFAAASGQRLPTSSPVLVRSPDEVVTHALRGFARGRAVVTPSRADRVVAAAARRAPDAVTRRVSALTHRRLVAS